MREEEINLVDRGKNTMVDMVAPDCFESVVDSFWKDDNEVIILRVKERMG